MSRALDRAIALYTDHFGEPPPLLVRAPGRVNLIGEHTDYNGGFVLPVALDREVVLAVRPRADRMVEMHSEAFAEPAIIALDELDRQATGWSKHLAGVAWALGEHLDLDALPGFEGVVTSDIPVGAGLSSSAAIQVATARTFCEILDNDWDPIDMAAVASRAENEWVGVASGPMDHIISASGRAGHAMLLDCRSLALKHIPIPDDITIAVIDTSTRRELVGSPFNERREACAVAAKAAGVDALRDVAPSQLDDLRGSVDDEVFRRARHVVTENQRTLAMVDVLRKGRMAEVGELIAGSHASLRDDYEVSTPELDAAVAAALAAPGCHAARLTGAGFGGCAVALVDSELTEEFAAATLQAYGTATGLSGSVYACRSADGASTVDADVE